METLKTVLLLVLSLFVIVQSYFYWRRAKELLLWVKIAFKQDELIKEQKSYIEQLSKHINLLKTKSQIEALFSGGWKN